MIDLNHDRVLQLYPEFDTVIPGYWEMKNGRKYVNLYCSKTKRKSSIMYAKLVLECKLGRRLVGDETTDHIDGNKTNDNPDNLQVLSRTDNAKKWSTLPRKYDNPYTKVNCLVCSKEFMKHKSELRRSPNSLCSRNCVAIHMNNARKSKNKKKSG